MRLLLEFKMKEEFMPTDYHKFVLKFIKQSLNDYEDGRFYDQFYNKDISKNKKKDISWSIKLNDPVFFNNRIEVKGKRFTITFVTPNEVNALVFMNSFMGQIKKDFKISEKNYVNLVKVRLKKEKTIKGNLVEFKLYSPLVIRNHDKDRNWDVYYTCEDNDFFEEFKNNLKRNFKAFSKEIDEMRLDATNLKKQVVPLYGQNIEVSVGTMVVLADNILLNEMYKKSIGSRKSTGFGVLEPINSWEMMI